MSPEQGLLRAILEDPDDDAPRLVYADWLEENGDADRAAFIRAQVRLAHFDWRAIPPGVERFPGELESLQRQADELWRRRKEQWLAELPAYLRRRRVRYHRGFVEELCGAPAHLLRVSARVWDRHPIRQLTIQDGPGELARVLALPQLGRVRKLSLMADLGKGDRAAMAAADGLSGVRVLSVMGGNGDPAYAALARCPSLHGLADLFLDAGLRNVTPDGLAALTASDNVAGLVALRLDMIYLKEHSALVVARSPRLAGLRFLRINGKIGDEGARALCESPHLGGLQSLELRSFSSVSAASRAALRERFGAALAVEADGGR
jgi:uncharacterized protein (TIGR02996 family)